MSLKELLEVYYNGSRAALADDIGCTRQAVYLWDESKPIPELYRYRLLNGSKADLFKDVII